MKTILFGDGYWGNIVKNKLEKNTNLISVLNSKSNIDTILESNNIDIAFVCSSTNSHYDIVKKLINNNINIFCEKPFTGDYNKACELFELAKKNNVSIYVDNIFLGRDEYKIINEKKLNNITNIKFIWNKNDNNFKEDLINSLLYHDLYILLSIYEFKLFIDKFKICDKKLYLKLITYDNKIIEFIYDRKNKIKKKIIFLDKIKIDFSTPKNDPLDIIIKKIVNNDYIDYDFNKKLTIDTLNFIEKIRKYGCN